MDQTGGDTGSRVRVPLWLFVVIVTIGVAVAGLVIFRPDRIGGRTPEASPAVVPSQSVANPSADVPPADSYEEDTAAIEALLRAYLSAAAADDADAAYAMWSDSARAAMSKEQFISQTEWTPGRGWGVGPFVFGGEIHDALISGPEPDKLWITSQEDSSADVEFQIYLGAENGIGGDLTVIEEDGVWRVDTCRMGSSGV